MHCSKAHLVCLFLKIHAALAAPNTFEILQPSKAANGLNIGSPLLWNNTYSQFSRRQDQNSGIGLTIYRYRNCTSLLWQVDLTTDHDITYIYPKGGYSFAPLYRGTQDQQQLDISSTENGNPCGNFIDSYFAGTSTSCNNWGDLTCFRFWKNSGS